MIDQWSRKLFLALNTTQHRFTPNAAAITKMNNTKGAQFSSNTMPTSKSPLIKAALSTIPPRPPTAASRSFRRPSSAKLAPEHRAASVSSKSQCTSVRLKPTTIFSSKIWKCRIRSTWDLSSITIRRNKQWYQMRQLRPRINSSFGTWSRLSVWTVRFWQRPIVAWMRAWCARNTRGCHRTTRNCRVAR